ncbi:hypothetical protein HY638_00950 [Candidatus Woesearchaeota archaeon]|nr:hypothetical protein [Candidatus Woesearchaeota archaeon]
MVSGSFSDSRLEGVIARSWRERPIQINRPVGESLFIEHFVSNMSDRQLAELGEKIGLATLIQVDYYLRFGGRVSESNDFASVRHPVDKFQMLLGGKDPHKFKTSEPEQFSLPNVNTTIAASVYSGLVSTEECKRMVQKAKSVNDLKAIVVIDSFLKDLYGPIANRTLASSLSPEGMFVGLLNQRMYEGNLRNLRNDISGLDSFFREANKISSGEIGMKDAKRLLQIQLEALKVASVYDKYRKNSDYAGLVAPLYDGVGRVYGYVDGIAREKTAGLLATVNWNFAPTSLKEDFRESIRQAETVSRVKDYCKWFGREIKELKEIEKSARARNAYLAKAIEAEKGINDLLGSFRGYYGELKKELSKDLANSVLRIESECTKHIHDFDSWRDDHYLSGLVKTINDTASDCIGIAARIRKDALADSDRILNAVNPYYEMSGKLEEDEQRLAMEEGNLKRAVEICGWFGVKNEKAEDAFKSVQDRKKYFSLVRKVISSAQAEQVLISEFRGSIGNLSFQDCSKEHLENLLSHAGIFEKRYADFHQHRGDIYLKGIVESLRIEAQAAEKSIGDKKLEIIMGAKEAVLSLRPDFESTGSLDEDTRINEGQRQFYARADGILKVLGCADDRCKEAGDSIERSYASYRQLYASWKSVQEDTKRIAYYGQEAKKVIGKCATQKSIYGILKLLENLRKYQKQFQECSSNQKLMSYAAIAQDVKKGEEAVIEARRKVIGALESRMQEINTHALGLVEYANKAEEYGNLSLAFRWHGIGRRLRHLREGREEAVVVGRVYEPPHEIVEGMDALISRYEGALMASSFARKKIEKFGFSVLGGVLMAASLAVCLSDSGPAYMHPTKHSSVQYESNQTRYSKPNPAPITLMQSPEKYEPKQSPEPEPTPEIHKDASLEIIAQEATIIQHDISKELQAYEQSLEGGNVYDMIKTHKQCNEFMGKLKGEGNLGAAASVAGYESSLQERISGIAQERFKELQSEIYKAQELLSKGRLEEAQEKSRFVKQETEKEQSLGLFSTRYIK